MTGLDPSPCSVGFARLRNPHAVIHSATLERYAECHPDHDFDVVLAIQVLQCVLDLETFLSSARKLLRPSGVLILSIPDPEKYLAGRQDVWSFAEGVERPYNIHFRIRGGETHPAKYWFFQRSWKTYVRSLLAAGLAVEYQDTPEEIGDGRRFDTTFLVCRAISARCRMG